MNIRAKPANPINAMCKQQAQNKPSAIARMAGRSGSGQSDLSVNYKKYLLEILDKKYPHATKVKTIAEVTRQVASKAKRSS